MEKNRILVAILSFLLLSAPFFSAKGEVFDCSSCQDCTDKIQSSSPGDIIVLTTDITAESGTSCINFNGKEGRTFDGNGHVITDGESVNYGIYLNTGTCSNNIIKNCIVNGFQDGLYLVYGSSNTVMDSTFFQNNTGIDFYSADSNTIQNVILTQNSIGISLRYDSDSNIIKDSYLYGNYTYGISFSPRLGNGDPEYNLIYNNHFRNSEDGNIRVGMISTEQDRVLENPNYFNVALGCLAGPNIAGCNCIGGNYWSNSAGDGFSDTCIDDDGNGICDDVYDFSTTNAVMIDNFPLTEPAQGCCANPDKDEDGYLSTVCGGDDCNDNPISGGAGCNPGAPEICDGYDNDCNGQIDDKIACKDVLLTKSAHYPTIISQLSCVEDSSSHKIYCFGGTDRAGTNEPQTDLIARYDPAADAVTSLSVTLPTIRDGLSCVEDSSTNKIYCFGGYWQEFVCTQWEPWGCVSGYSTVHYLDDILEFDPTSETISIKTTKLPTGIDSLSCVEDSSTHKIYCFGGASYGPAERNQILEYDPETDTLTTMSAVLPSERTIFSCVEDSSTHKIYCFGGHNDSGSLNEIIEYNPATDQVTTKNATFPVRIHWLSCVEDSATHKIYCFGGYTPDNDAFNASYLDRIFEYDPAADTLTLMEATFPRGRFALSCAENSATNRIYCFGGARNVVCCDDISEYITESWLKGDLNHDCTVNESDLAIFSASFGRTNCNQEESCQGDFTGDGDQDGSDLARLAANFGLTDCP